MVVKRWYGRYVVTHMHSDSIGQMAWLGIVVAIAQAEVNYHRAYPYLSLKHLYFLEVNQWT